MILFKEEFEGLPEHIQIAFRKQLEEVIRQVYQRHMHSRKDHEIRDFTKSEINGMIFAVFDLAEKTKNLLSDDQD